MIPETSPDRTGDDVARARCQANLVRVREMVAASCHRAGRESADVRIVGVTKYVPLRLARFLCDAGCNDLGESRPQALWERGPALPEARFHLIGRLQRNKVRRTLPLVSLIHSLDSDRLLEAIASEAEAAGLVCDALVEVNLDGDPARGGLAPEHVSALLDGAAARAGVRIRGLMGMASAPCHAADADLPRRQFASLRSLRDRLAGDHPGLVELSMGMSGDFPEAILEGATIVRIGSALWDGLTTDD